MLLQTIEGLAAPFDGVEFPNDVIASLGGREERPQSKMGLTFALFERHAHAKIVGTILVIAAVVVDQSFGSYGLNKGNPTLDRQCCLNDCEIRSYYYFFH